MLAFFSYGTVSTFLSDWCTMCNFFTGASPMNRTSLLTTIFLSLALWPVTAQAPQEPPPQQQDAVAEPESDPSRGAARISLLNGEVSVRRGDSGDVVAAAINAPLVTQDRVLTASSSRAEVQFDSANMLRIGSNSE